MRIDIWSDVVCPWCYLGARRLDLALDRLPWSDQVTVHWRAYQLDPSAPTEPSDLRAAIERKYGRGAFDGMVSRLTALGAEIGLVYRFDLAQRINTFDAHRLLAWAGELGHAQQGALAERLFQAYFTRGENVADRTLLLTVSADVGLDAAVAAAVLDDDRYHEAIALDVEAALERGISGVPAFVIGGAWMIPGAQDVDTIVSVLERARQKLVPIAPAATADECAVDEPRC